jgi:hypothetical protein
MSAMLPFKFHRAISVRALCLAFLYARARLSRRRS